jgi:hypothetical protein
LDHSIFYVDIENLQDIAKEAVAAALANWPEGFPQPGIVKLYVKADITEMWKIWASHNIPGAQVQVKGVQHYTFAGSKNSADLFLALDALADFLKGRTKYIAVFSDDSDFASLLAAVKNEMNPSDNPRALFKWFMTNRPDTRSQVLTDFLPSEYIHTVAAAFAPALEEGRFKRELPEKLPQNNSLTIEEQIAVTIIREIPLGLFKSVDCKKILVRNFPKHPMANANSAAFGTQFANEIWPILEKYGVQIPNPNAKPRKYEMTDEAKRKVAQSED